MKTRRTRTLRKIERRGGFTLTELLIVMAILVLLVSMIGPKLLGSKKKADISSVKTQIGMLQSALERYAVDNNKFPSTEQGLSALVANPAEEGDRSQWDGPYLKKTALPKDPWGNTYSYEYPSAHTKEDAPDIWSFGPDGEEDTEDDIISWTVAAGDGSGEDLGEEDASAPLGN